MFFGGNLPVPRLVWTSPRPRQKGAVILIASKFVDSSNVQSVSVESIVLLSVLSSPILPTPSYTPFRRDDSVINMFVVMIIIIGIVLFIRIVFGWSESESRKTWPPIQVQSSASLLKVGSSVKVIHVLICFCHAYPKAMTAVQHASL